jgi:hypothetical protein
MTLGCAHSLETALPADLAALAAYRRHVLGEVNWGIGGGSRLGSLLWRFVGRAIHNPLRKLVWVAWAFAFSYSHDFIMPQAGMLKRPCEKRN